MTQNKTSKIAYPIIFILALILDRATKQFAVSKLAGRSAVNVIGEVFQFVYIENAGAAFGMMQNKRVLFYIITALVAAAILYFIIKMPSDSRYTGLGVVLSFILAGAIGNFIDRAWHHYVVDFIYFSPIDFPVFNVADIYVTLGCIAFVIMVIFIYKDHDFDFLDPRKKNEN